MHVVRSIFYRQFRLLNVSDICTKNPSVEKKNISNCGSLKNQQYKSIISAGGFVKKPSLEIIFILIFWYFQMISYSFLLQFLLIVNPQSYSQQKLVCTWVSIIWWNQCKKYMHAYTSLCNNISVQSVTKERELEGSTTHVSSHAKLGHKWELIH